jgi:hypothetical protein
LLVDFAFVFHVLLVAHQVGQRIWLRLSLDLVVPVLQILKRAQFGAVVSQ